MNWATFKQMVTMMVKSEAEAKAKPWLRDAAKFLRTLANDIDPDFKKDPTPDVPETD